METQPYKQGQVKHFMIAIWQGINGDSDKGIDYIKWELKDKQILALNF